MVDYAYLSSCSAYVMYVIVTCSIIFCRYWVYKKSRWRTSARTRWLCEDPEGVIIKEIHSTRTIHYPTSSENNRHLLYAGALIATACWVDFPGKEQDRRRFVPKAPIVSAISVHSNHSYWTERNLVRTKRKEAYLIETWTTGMQEKNTSLRVCYECRGIKQSISIVDILGTRTKLKPRSPVYYVIPIATFHLVK